MNFLSTLILAVSALAGLQLNRRYPSVTGYVIAIVTFIGSAVFVGALNSAPALLAGVCYIPACVAFGYLLGGIGRR